MRRSGRWSILVGGVLFFLALFNIYTMMTVYHQHTCNKEETKTGTSYGSRRRFDTEPQDAERQPLYGIEHNSLRRDYGAANRWPHRGWNGGDDQMAGLVAPAERKNQMEGQMGVEGVLKHKAHGEILMHRSQINMTLVSEINSTIHDWPWPNSVRTHQMCEEKNWGPVEKMPTTSVVITFHETETISHLLRTVHSLIQRTPKILLKEIILVSDNVHKDDLKDVLEVYINAVFEKGLVELIKSKESLGLIKARLVGEAKASGDVVVFMDSHMEVQHHWLEPLLHEIMVDRRTLASSFLDWFEMISADTSIWRYRHGDTTWVTYFDWSFTFGFQELGANDKRKNKTDPVRSPVTVGGMFAIERKFFHEIGTYDSLMTRWGGENVDLAFRVWMCGGRVLNVPCSHAGHFESSTSRSYRDNWAEDIQRNYQRVVEVWLGPYKKYFYENFPQLKDKDPGDLSARFKIRSNCKRPFQWILQNVIPQLGLPDVDSVAYGGLESLGFPDQCLDARDLRRPGMSTCNPGGIQSQNFYWSLEGTLRMPIHVVKVMPPAGQDPTLYLDENTKLHNTTARTVWFHVKGGFMVDITSGKCMQADFNHDLTLQPCDPEQKRQRWQFRTYNDIYFKIINNQVITEIDPTLLKSFSQYSNLALRKRHKRRRSKSNFTETGAAGAADQ